MRILQIAAAAFLLSGTAQAATISINNGDFEEDTALSFSDPNYGAWDTSATGWEVSGNAGTWEFPDWMLASDNSSLDNRIGYAATGGYLAQNLFTKVEYGVDYTLSATFLRRSDSSGYAGSFGFFVGDITGNYAILSLMDVIDPGIGLFSEQTITLSKELLNDYIGQHLGIIFIGENGQIQFDNVAVNYFSDVAEVPLPGAAWLFLSALFGGGLIARRRKAVKASAEA